MTEKRAAAAYKRFHDEEPKSVVTVQLPDHDRYGYRMGRVEAIAYRAKRGGSWDSYIHEFGRAKGPYLDVTDDGAQLNLTDGDYRVTDHGIEDGKMPALFVINPHKLGSKPKTKVLNTMTKRNSKGQFVKGSSRAKTKSRTSNPSPPKRKRSTAVAATRSTTSPKVVFMNPAPVHRKRKRKSNPYRMSGSKGLLGGINLVELGVAGLSQATGAIATSAAVAFMPLPPALKSGPTGVVVKIMAGIAMAALIAKFGKHSPAVRAFAQNFAEGTVTLAMVDWIKGALPQGIELGMVSDEGFGLVRQIDDGMALIQNSDGTMQYITAANVVQDSSMAGATQYQYY